MTQPETNTGLLVEFDTVRMGSNLVLVAIYKKGQNFKIAKNFKNFIKIKYFPKFQENSKFSENFKTQKFQN
jgi:hypothetical protein